MKPVKRIPSNSLLEIEVVLDFLKKTSLHILACLSFQQGFIWLDIPATAKQNTFSKTTVTLQSKYCIEMTITLENELCLRSFMFNMQPKKRYRSFSSCLHMKEKMLKYIKYLQFT